MARLRTDVPILVDENGDVAVSAGKLGIQGDSSAPGLIAITAGVYEENGNMRFRWSGIRDWGGIVFDNIGNVYISTGIAAVTPFTPDRIDKLDRWGRNIWSGTTMATTPPDWTTNGGSNWITLDRAGDLLLCGRPWKGVSGSISDMWKISGETGEIIWSQLTTMAPANGLKQIATDSENNIIVVGSGQNSTDNAIIQKYDSNGQLLWTRTGPPPFKISSIFLCPVSNACCVDKEDNIYISVEHTYYNDPFVVPSSGLVPPEDNIIAIKFDKFGNELYNVHPPAGFLASFPLRDIYRGKGVVCNTAGDLVMAFFTQSGGVEPETRGLFADDQNGNPLWESTPFDTNGQPPTRLNADSSGNIFCITPNSNLLYIDGNNGTVLTDYPFPGDFPANPAVVAISRPDALIGPVTSGRSNLFDSGYYLNHDIQDRFSLPISSGDEVQGPGNSNQDDDSEINIAEGIFRAIEDIDGSSLIHDETNSVDIYDKLTSSAIKPAPSWRGLGPASNPNPYTVGNRVFHTTVFYRCILDHSPPHEPGVDANWMDFWEITGPPTQPFDSIDGFGGKGFNDPLDPDNTTPQFYTAAFHGILNQLGDDHTLNGVYQCGKIYGGSDSVWRHLKYQPPKSSVHAKVSMGIDITRVQLFRDDSESTTISVFDFTSAGSIGALLTLSQVANEQVDIDDDAIEGSFGIAGIYPGEINEWAVDIEYDISDKVAWEGRFYVATAPNTGQEPGGTSVWDQFN